MFLPGFGETVTDAELRAPEWRKTASGECHQLENVLAVGTLVEPGVKSGVVDLIIFLGTEMHEPRRCVVFVLQRHAFVDAHARGGESCAYAFQFGHAFEHR